MAAVAPEEAFGLDWPYPLFGYQKEGIEKLLDGRSVLLADEMGLGKTIQAIAAIRILVARKEIARALIVCPVTLIAQWRRQIRIWAPELAVSTAIGGSSRRIAAWRADAALYLSSFESVRADFSLPSKGASRIWDVVVVDEAQRIKNAKSSVAAVVKSLKRARSWALTGTPLENRLDDLLSVLDFAAPGEFDPQAMGVGLRALMARVQLRRRRAEVLDDLPPKFAAVIGLDLTAAQRAAYRKAEEKGTIWLRSLGRQLRISHVLELILRLKQICNFCPETGDSAKLDDLRRRLDEFRVYGANQLLQMEIDRRRTQPPAILRRRLHPVGKGRRRPPAAAGAGVDQTPMLGDLDQFLRQIEDLARLHVPRHRGRQAGAATPAGARLVNDDPVRIGDPLERIALVAGLSPAGLAGRFAQARRLLPQAVARRRLRTRRTVNAKTALQIGVPPPRNAAFSRSSSATRASSVSIRR